MWLLTPDDLLIIHRIVIEETGGAAGLRDPGMLEAIAAKPAASFDGKGLYPDVSSQAAALYDAIVNYHIFVDGNKRTAIGALGLFLAKNGHDFQATNQEIVQFTLQAATTNPDLADIAIWVKAHSNSI